MSKQRWKLTDEQWRKIEPLLPKQYLSPSTCWMRLRGWEEQDVWLHVWRAFLVELEEKGQLDWSEAFADGSFASAKKGRWRWKDQTRQGNKVDGGGRRPRYFFGKPLGFGVPERR